MRKLLSLALAACLASPAKASDTDSVEHLVAAVYDVISGPAGAPRDWDRFRNLFYPDAGRMQSSGRDADGKIYLRNLSVEDYITRAGTAFEKMSFYESAVANRIEQWDHIAEVWSTYESRHAPGEAPFARGVNSFHAIHDGSRWWLLAIYWESEDSAHPLPDKYLKQP
jgi:hypothetical protein